MTQPYQLATLPVHKLGSRRTLQVTVRDEHGELIDPAELTFTMTTPDAQVTTYLYGTDIQVVRDSLGVYSVSWLCNKLGRHSAEFVAAGNISARVSEEFLVQAAEVQTGWPVDESCLPVLGSGDAEDETLMATRSTAIQLAASIMWALSGRQFGIYDTVIRPCIETRFRRHGHTRTGVASYLVSWETDGWHNWSCGCSGGGCRYSGPRAVHLPGPVVAVIKVTVADTVLGPAEYSAENNTLYRTGQYARWPRQDLSRPLGSPNTWSVEYLRGTPIPNGVDRLTGALAAEFLNACRGEKCRLPRSLSQLTRNGLSFQVDANAIFNAGRTGLTEVDQWLASVNPNKLAQPPSVI